MMKIGTIKTMLGLQIGTGTIAMIGQFSHTSPHGTRQIQDIGIKSAGTDNKLQAKLSSRPDRSGTLLMAGIIQRQS